MRTFVDTAVLKRIMAGSVSEEMKDVVDVEFYWPSLFIYLGIDNVFEKYPAFDAANPLFSIFLETLKSQDNRGELIYLYDQLFAETLSELKLLPQVNADFFIDNIPSENINPLFSKTLNSWKELFSVHPKGAIHDLMLYLAWDRVTVALATLFEVPSTQKEVLEGLNVLRECLEESLEHIAVDGKSQPSFFRYMEAIWALQMREEKLQSHPEADWAILSQSAPILKSRERLPNVPYIDENIKFARVGNENKYYVSETPEVVKAGLELANLVKPGYIQTPDITYIVKVT